MNLPPTNLPSGNQASRLRHGELPSGDAAVVSMLNSTTQRIEALDVWP